MIGVFDSGSGGLTVLRALVERLPDQRFVYLGDHGHAPYGERSPDEVYGLTCAGVSRLFGLGCSLVILACNTAAAVALRRLQQTWLPARFPEHRVLGVLVPMVESVTQVSWEVKAASPAAESTAGRVGIFATPRTVESGAYPREIGLRAPAVEVFQQACPSLVQRIEAGATAETLADQVAAEVRALRARAEGGHLDRVILGCTHYPLVEAAFRAALPPEVAILSQPRLVAESLADYLRRHPRHRTPRGAGQSRIAAFSTAEAKTVRALGRRFFGETLAFCQIGGQIGGMSLPPGPRPAPGPAQAPTVQV